MPAALDIDWELVAEEYLSGEDGPSLAEKYNTTPRTIYRHLDRLGIERRSGSVTKEQRERIKKVEELLSQGLSYEEV
jgi:hypothetical protein